MSHLSEGFGSYPLRERREDIPLLIRHFMANHCERIGKLVVGIDDEVQDVLCSYSYPGNVRQLEHIIERAIILCEGDVITLDSLPREVLTATSSDRGTEARVTSVAIPKTNEELKAAKTEAQQRIELMFLRDLLSSTRGNVSEAARKAGMNRYWLMELIKKHDLDVNHFKSLG